MRRLLIAGAILVLLAAIAVLMARQVLASARLRAEVETRLSAMLGQRVSLGRLDITIVPTLSVAATTVRVGEARVQAPALDIDRVRILPIIRSLWNRDIAIERIELEGFHVSVLRDRRGGWHVPTAVPAPSAAAGGGPAIGGVRVTHGAIRVFDEAADGTLAQTATIEDLDADVAIEAGGLRLAPIRARIGAATISGDARTDASAVRLAFATEAIADTDLPVFLGLLGSDRPAFLRVAQPASASVTIQVDRASSRMTGNGMLRIPELLLDRVRLQRIQAPFTIKGNSLAFDPIGFGMYGGAHRGTVSVDLAAAPPAWTADSRVTALQVGPFLQALTGSDQRVDGVASIDGVLRGRIGAPLDRTLRGRSRLEMARGVIRNFPLLATINRSLRIAEQQDGDTRFDRLSATMEIASGVATTDDLVLEASELLVNLAGRIGADRSLALRGHAVVSAERVAQGVARYPELARLKNRQGEIDVPVTISGSLDAPSIAVDVKTAIGQGIAEELRRRLRRLIR